MLYMVTYKVEFGMTGGHKRGHHQMAVMDTVGVMQMINLGRYVSHRPLTESEKAARKRKPATVRVHTGRMLERMCEIDGRRYIW